MSVDIHIAQTGDEHPQAKVVIAPHTFTAFREFLTGEERRTGLSLAGQGYQHRLILPAFEVRAKPFALATLVRIFDYDEAMICLVEEAQFRGLCLTVRPLADGGADLSLSDTTDEQFASQLGTISPAVSHQWPRAAHSGSAGSRSAQVPMPQVTVGRHYPADLAIAQAASQAGRV